MWEHAVIVVAVAFCAAVTVTIALIVTTIVLTVIIVIVIVVVTIAVVQCVCVCVCVCVIIAHQIRFDLVVVCTMFVARCIFLTKMNMSCTDRCDLLFLADNVDGAHCQHLALTGLQR